MSSVLHGPEEATAARLSAALEGRGVLSGTAVRRVGFRRQSQNENSATFRLSLEYEGERPPQAPDSIVLKLTRPGFKSGRKEVHFYNTIAGGTAEALMPCCFEAAFSESTGSSHLLLEDLSESHFATEYPLPPKRAESLDAARSLARFHASWWDHERLAADLEPVPTAEQMGDWVAAQEGRLGQLVDFLDDRLSPERVRLLEQALDALPRLWEREGRLREGTRKGLTLSHGDFHTWNCLFPLSPQRDRVRILDWQNWRAAVGTDDLADWITLYCFRDRRRHLEADLVRAYHTELLDGGIKGYSWPDCWHDYRVSALLSAFFPLDSYARQGRALSWWPLLDNALSALEDLDCAELLGGT